MSVPENNPMYGKKHSEETKRKIAIKATGRTKSKKDRKSISKRMTGKNNPMYGKSINTKTYYFLDPKGNPVTIHNMARFCRENNLLASCMMNVWAQRNRRSHAGWRKDLSKYKK